MERVLSLGVKPERIIYANACKQASMIRYARDVHVRVMTFDNATELIKIKQLYPEAKYIIPLVLIVFGLIYLFLHVRVFSCL